jgi:alginate biosynthesis protein AlgX
MMRRIVVICALAAPAPVLAGPSGFGCANTEFAPSASIEGRDGVFYRVQADLRLQHPMDEIVVEQLAELARTLAEQGTTLVYANVPTKGQAMPRYLPPEAVAYGYDEAMMQANYLDVVNRLNAAGVTAPDLMTAMLEAKPDELVFFPADFHWTPTGARLAAKAIGETIRKLPAYEAVTPIPFVSKEGGPDTAFSGLRRELQTFCKETLPPVKAVTWITSPAEVAATQDQPAEGAALDIFGTDAAAASLVLAGTSFSDSNINNFAGFLSEFTGIEVTNYSITGGNQFGAMTSYLTSREFAEQRPTFLIWENPIYNGLAQFGPLPMEELIAAAGPSCDIGLGAAVEDGAVTASVTPGSLGRSDNMLLDYGRDGARVANVTLIAASGLERHVRIERGDRLRATGRFFLNLDPYWMPDLSGVSVTFDRPVGEDSTITLCPPRKGDAS